MNITIIISNEKKETKDRIRQTPWASTEVDRTPFTKTEFVKSGVSIERRCW